MNLYDTGLCVWSNSYVSNRFPSLSRPKIRGYFSIDTERRYIPSADYLQYLQLPQKLSNLDFNLNKGYENVIRKPGNPTDEGLIHLLEFLRDNKDKFKSASSEYPGYFRTDFITYRGILRMIMCFPYERRDDACLLVTKYKGNIYIRQQETEKKRKRIEAETDVDKKNCSYGFKFEQFIFSDDPKNLPDTTVPVNEAEEFSCVLMAQFEKHQLLYGAEMDGIVSSEKVDLSKVDPNSLEFVEVKVRRMPKNYNQRESFLRNNLRKWWAQSFLVGIQRIYMGLRNDSGFVKEIQVLNMDGIPNMGKAFWSAAVCLDFLNVFLDMLKATVKDVDCPYSVYEFHWDPQVHNTIMYRLHEGRNELSFLPDWYIECLNE